MTVEEYGYFQVADRNFRSVDPDAVLQLKQTPKEKKSIFVISCDKMSGSPNSQRSLTIFFFKISFDGN